MVEWTVVLQLCRSGRISWADMVLAPSVAGLFKWRQFEPEVILLAVGWYLRFSLSYRDVEDLLAERGLHVAVGKREAQVPADGKQDHLRFKLAPLEQSGNRWDTEHPSILAARLPGQASKVATLPSSQRSYGPFGPEQRSFKADTSTFETPL